MFGAQTEIGINRRRPRNQSMKFRDVEVVVAFDVAFLAGADEDAVLVCWRGGHFERGRGWEGGGFGELAKVYLRVEVG
jgi:hypothetical protein